MLRSPLFRSFLSTLLAVTMLLVRVPAQVPENSPRPKADFPDRAAPAMTMEQAIALARQSLQAKNIPLGPHFLAHSQYCFAEGKSLLPEAKAHPAPYWYLEYQSPALEHPRLLDPRIPPNLRILVFPDGKTAIIAP